MNNFVEKFDIILKYINSLTNNFNNFFIAIYHIKKKVIQNN